MLESSGVLISGGNLIKKILFPAEVLPVVVVLSNMVHFFFGLPILFAFLLYYGKLQATLVYFAGDRSAAARLHARSGVSSSRRSRSTSETFRTSSAT